MSVDYNRQLEIFNPDEFSTPIHVIGCGATGSWVAFILAKLGVKNVTLYDFDNIEEHNIPNQIFPLVTIGESKAISLKAICNSFAGVEYVAKEEKVTQNTEGLEGIVLNLVDSMASRKKIYTGALKGNPKVQLLIETRMGLDNGRVYAINPNNVAHQKNYEQTLYSDEEATVSFCGNSQSVGVNACTIASMVVWHVINFHHGNSIPQEIILDALNYTNHVIPW